MAELGIEGICANSPHAKGRVERANGVFQDHQAKLMRLAGMEADNAFLPEFLADYNERFSQPPAEPANAHAPACSPERLRTIPCLKETRKLSRQLTYQYHQQWQHVPPLQDGEHRLVGAEVEIREHLNGALDIHHHGQKLAYELLAARIQAPVVDAKVVQARLSPSRPPANHP